MPKGLSAGDGGLTQPRSTSISVESFPQFSSKVSESKLYTPTIEQAPIPEIADEGYEFPSGCPYDLIPYIDGEEDSSTKSGIAAVRHTNCEKSVGNNIYDRWTTLVAENERAGFNAFLGEYLDGYVEVATKGQEETYVYGYADQGDSNFRMRSFGADSEIELWIDDNSEYLLMRASPNKTSIFGYADNQVYNFLLGADKNADSSYLRVYGNNSNVYATIATESGKSVVYGYADNQVYNYTLAADKNEDSSYLRVYGNNSNVYATLATEQSKSVLFGYANDGAFNYLTTATREKSGSQYYDQNKDGYVEIATKGQEETYVYGYADQGESNFRLRAFGAESLCEVFNNQIGGFAKIFTDADGSGFSTSQDNDFSYLTQTTLRIEYANGDYLNAVAGEMYVGYASGAYSYLFGGGLYIDNGSNFVDIRPPYGKDAYFQLTQWISLTGGIEQAYVLRSETLPLGIPDWLQSILDALANLASAIFNLALELAALAAQFAAQLAALAAEFAAKLAAAVADLKSQLRQLATNVQSALNAISSELVRLSSELTQLSSKLTEEVAKLIEKIKSRMPNGNSRGDLLYWDPQAGEGGAWVVLNTSGAQKGSLLVWGEDTWQILNAPQGGDLHVLSVQNGEISWIQTQDCET